MGGLTNPVLQEIEDAKRTGVKPTAHVWSVLEWIAGDREIIQIADNAAWCQECGSLTVVPRGDWDAGFRCAFCFEKSRDECCYCGEDISEGPSWPDLWPRRICGSCY